MGLVCQLPYLNMKRNVKKQHQTWAKELSLPSTCNSLSDFRRWFLCTPKQHACSSVYSCCIDVIITLSCSSFEGTVLSFTLDRMSVSEALIHVAPSGWRQVICTRKVKAAGSVACRVPIDRKPLLAHRRGRYLIAIAITRVVRPLATRHGAGRNHCLDEAHLQTCPTSQMVGKLPCGPAKSSISAIAVHIMYMNTYIGNHPCLGFSNIIPVTRIVSCARRN